MKGITRFLLVAIFISGNLLTSCSKVSQDAQQTSLLGRGWGIDHVVIAVRDLEAAKNTYRDVLGFNIPPGDDGIHPTGTKNSTADFENVTYLELIAIDDLEKAKQNRPVYVDFLEQHQGALFLALNTSNAEETVKFLRSVSFEVSDPDPGTIISDGEKNVPGPLWWTVRFKKASLPTDPIFFIEYKDAKSWDEESREAKSDSKTRHTNTAKGISCVWSQ
jgi:hypothetical protein